MNSYSNVYDGQHIDPQLISAQELCGRYKFQVVREIGNSGAGRSNYQSLKDHPYAGGSVGDGLRSPVANAHE